MQSCAAGATWLRCALIAVGIILGAVGAKAQDERILWSVIGTGGVVGATDGSVLFSATVGQPVIGPTGDPTLQLQQGFWIPIVSGPAGVDDQQGEVVAGSAFRLKNFPNPVVTTTNFSYLLPEKSKVRLEIVDLSGRIVRSVVDQIQDAGEQQIEWDGKTQDNEKASSGVYLYVLTVEPLFGTSPTGDRVRTERQKLVVVH